MFTGGPWFNFFKCLNTHGPIFEEFFVTACIDRYDRMRGLHADDKKNDKSTDVTNFGGGSPIPYDSTTISLVSILVCINLIYTWLTVLGKKIDDVVPINRRCEEYLNKFILKYQSLILKISGETSDIFD